MANFKTLSLLPGSRLPSSLLQFLPTIFVFKCVRMFHPGKWWTPRRVRVLCEVTNLGFVCWRDTIGYGEFTTAINPSTGSRWLHSALETRQYSGCHIFQSRRLWNNKLFNAPVNLSLLRQQHLKLSGSLFIVMVVENGVCFVDFVEGKQRKEKRRLLRSTIACRCTIRECPSAAKCLCLSFRSCSKQWWPRCATNTAWEITKH